MADDTKDKNQKNDKSLKDFKQDPEATERPSETEKRTTGPTVLSDMGAKDAVGVGKGA